MKSLALLLCLLVPGALHSEIRTKGYLFGDYYYVASGANKEQNGFQIRRIYLTFDKRWDNRFTGRVRLEANDAGFGVGEKMNAVIKDAYLKYKKKGRSLIVGLSPTPTWSFTEKVWGYRSVEKTIIDRNKIGSSRDLGVFFESPVDSEGRVKIQLMLGNGNSNKSESNNDKKGYVRLDLVPSKTFGVNLYADYETRPDDQNRTTLATLLYAQSRSRAFGFEAVWQQRKNAVAGTDSAVRGISLFGRAKRTEEVGFFGRVDFLDPSDQASGDAVTRIFAGVDITPDPQIHIMPNVIVETFQDSAVETVITPRVTLYFIF